MKQMKEKAKAKHSGEPSPGTDAGAAAAVAEPAPAPRRKLDKEDEEWVRANALPRVHGCTVTHIVDAVKMKWTAAYPGCNTRSRNYGAAGGGAAVRTCRTTMNHVLHWVWQRHFEATGEECPWDFTPRCT